MECIPTSRDTNIIFKAMQRTPEAKDVLKMKLRMRQDRNQAQTWNNRSSVWIDPPKVDSPGRRFSQILQGFSAKIFRPPPDFLPAGGSRGTAAPPAKFTAVGRRNLTAGRGLGGAGAPPGLAAAEIPTEFPTKFRRAYPLRNAVSINPIDQHLWRAAWEPGVRQRGVPV